MRTRWRWLVGAIAGLFLVLTVLGFCIDEPLRRYMEREWNKHLPGYKVRIGALDFHAFSFSLDLKNVVISRQAQPDPPLARIAQLRAGVHWRALLSARAVAEFLVERPRVCINRKLVDEVIEASSSGQGWGWQEALQGIYPLQAHEVTVVEGEVTYADVDAVPLLHLSQLHVRAANMQHIGTQDPAYPAEISLAGRVFDAGEVLLEGRADFLTEPYVSLKAQLTLAHVEVEALRPLVGRYHIAVRNGTLSGVGTIEYAPHTKVVHLQSVTLSGVQLEYMYHPQPAAAQSQRAKKGAPAAQAMTPDSALLLRADQVTLVKSHVGFVNTAANPKYRLFVTDTEGHLTNLSNRLTDGATSGKLPGHLMGTSALVATATFRPETTGPDFDLAVRLEKTRMRALNDLWRTYGKFDVVAGFFSFDAALTVKNGTVTGYVTPVFKDLDAYDRRQDREKTVFRQVYEGVVGGLAGLLEDAPRAEVAPQAEISARIEAPQASDRASGRPARADCLLEGDRASIRKRARPGPRLS